jgi:hypothetical protein
MSAKHMRMRTASRACGINFEQQLLCSSLARVLQRLRVGRAARASRVRPRCQGIQMLHKRAQPHAQSWVRIRDNTVHRRSLQAGSRLLPRPAHGVCT